MTCLVSNLKKIDELSSLGVPRDTRDTAMKNVILEYAKKDSCQIQLELLGVHGISEDMNFRKVYEAFKEEQKGYSRHNEFLEKYRDIFPGQFTLEQDIDYLDAIVKKLAPITF